MTRLLHLTTTPVSLDWLLGPQLEAFASAGYEVVTASAPGDHVENLVSRGIAHHRLESFTRSVDLASDLRSIAELRELLIRLQPDILHTHNPKPGVLGRVVGRWSRIPVVLNTVHGLYAQKDDGFVRRAAVYGAERFAAAHSDAELVQNIEDVETLRWLGIDEQRIHLLGNGIDLDTFAPNPSRARAARCLRIQLGIPFPTVVVGIVGRLVWEKGYGEFFDAIKILRRRFSSDQVAFVVCGPAESGHADGVDPSSIEKMRQNCGVHFLGQRSDIATVMSAFDVFALPSHREGFPRAAMEASAMGVPVVASNIRGCRQVVEHQKTGLLVRAHRPHHLALALERLVTSPALRTQMGRAGRTKAIAEFDQRQVIDTTLSVYEMLLREKGLPVPAQVVLPEAPWYADSINLVERDASNLDDPASDASAIDVRSA